MQTTGPTHRRGRRPAPQARDAAPGGALQQSACALCEHPQVPLLVRFGGLSVGRCPRCGSGLVLRIDGTSEHDADDYSARYEKERLRDKAAACFDLLLERTGRLQGVGSILDIGCGEGDFLDLAKRAGLCTAGIELSPQSAAAAVRRGHEVFCQSATDGPFPGPGQFDVVVLWDLLEHLTHPCRALQCALAALAPGGRLLVLTPAMGSFFDRAGLRLYWWSGRRFDRLLRMCWSRDHRFRFDPAGIGEVIRSFGFRDVLVQRVQLLSLRPECYAGGAILPSWTGWSGLDRWISRAGVGLARLLRLHNKILIDARRGAH